MTHRPLDPRVADRIRRYADGPGSPSAKAAITAWISRAQLGSTDVGSPESLADLVRALTRLAYSRGLYGFEEMEAGSDLDVRLQRLDFAEALSIEADLVEHYKLGRRGQDVVTTARTEAAENTFGTLERAFQTAFK